MLYKPPGRLVGMWAGTEIGNIGAIGKMIVNYSPPGLPLVMFRRIQSQSASLLVHIDGGSWILGISLLAISLISFKPFKYLAEKSGVKFQPSCRWVALVFTIG